MINEEVQAVPLDEFAHRLLRRPVQYIVVEVPRCILYPCNVCAFGGFGLEGTKVVPNASGHGASSIAVVLWLAPCRRAFWDRTPTTAHRGQRHPSPCWSDRRTRSGKARRCEETPYDDLRGRQSLSEGVCSMATWHRAWHRASRCPFCVQDSRHQRRRSRGPRGGRHVRRGEPVKSSVMRLRQQGARPRCAAARGAASWWCKSSKEALQAGRRLHRWHEGAIEWLLNLWPRGLANGRWRRGSWEYAHNMHNNMQIICI